MSCEIVIHHQYAYVVPESGCYDEVLGIVDAATSWEDPQAQYSDAFLRGHWDGRHRLLSIKSARFPSGLVPIVEEALAVAGYTCSVHDERQYPAYNTVIPDLEGIVPYPFQLKAVQSGIEAKHCIFKCPPGSGKTEMMILLVATLEQFPVLWLTDRRILIEQTYQRFKARLGHRPITVGRVGAGSWEPADIMIATVQTLTYPSNKVATRTLLKQAQVVISDECHRAPTRTWHTLLMRCEAPLRFGCSATPLARSDGASLSLIGSTGEVAFELSAADGVDQGVFVMPRLVFVDYPFVPKPCSSLNTALSYSWQAIYARGISENASRNAAILQVCKQAVEAGRSVLVLVRLLHHGRFLETALQEWFQSTRHAQFIRGANYQSEREAAIADVQSGVCRVLIASSILDEGVDIPKIDTVVIASAGKSAIKAIQRAGRGMRKGDGDKDLVVYDFVDSSHRMLLTHSQERMKAYSEFSQCDVERVSLKELQNVE